MKSVEIDVHAEEGVSRGGVAPMVHVPGINCVEIRRMAGLNVSSISSAGLNRNP